MRQILTLTALLALSTITFAQTKRSDTSRFVAEKGANKATIVFTTKPFDRTQRKMEISRDSGTTVTRVDGRRTYGTDASVPTREIKSFRFYFNGLEVPVPRRLYSDCFEPNTKAGDLMVKFGDDSDSVFVFMNGSDGAGVYDVIWVLRKDGRHSRIISAGGDCRLFDLECGLSVD